MRNVSDSDLNYFGAVPNGEKWKCFRAESIWNVLSFLTAIVKRRNGCLSDSDLLTSHFHWIWNVSTNGPNDFTNWFWFDRESFSREKMKYFCFSVNLEPYQTHPYAPFGKVKRFRFRLESLGAVSNRKKSKRFRGESVWNVSSFCTVTMKRQNRCFKWFWFTSFSFPLNLKRFNKRLKRFYKVILIRPRIISREKLKCFWFIVNLEPYQTHP
jgi:hypothetical protein